MAGRISPHSLREVHPTLATELVDVALGEVLAPQSNTAVKWRCLSHPNIHANWTTTPGLRVSQGTGCPACAKMPYDWREQLLRLGAEGYRVQLSYRDRRHLLEGQCRLGHAFSAEVRLIRVGRRCVECRTVDAHQDALRTAADLGYVVSLVRPSPPGRIRLEGACQSGHPVSTTLDNFKRGKRCGACRTEQIHRDFAAAVEGTGLHLKLVLMRAPGMADKATFAVGACAQGHDVQVLAGALADWKGCWECRLIAGRQTLVEALLSEGYTSVEYVPADDKNRKARFAGVCPVGHAIDSPYESVAKGSRCPSCAVRGFKPELPAEFYVAVCRDFRGHGEVIQFGISNDADARLSRHARNGFDRDGAIRLAMPGRDAQSVETAVKRALRGQGVRSCADAGVRFDGATESFFADELSVASFQDLVRSVVDARVGSAIGVEAA